MNVLGWILILWVGWLVLHFVRGWQEGARRNRENAPMAVKALDEAVIASTPEAIAPPVSDDLLAQGALKFQHECAEWNSAVVNIPVARRMPSSERPQ